MPKKKWRKPNLIILVRSRDDESVLTSCSMGGKDGPTSDQISCKEGAGFYCSSCSGDFSS